MLVKLTPERCEREMRVKPRDRQNGQVEKGDRKNCLNQAAIFIASL
jgi:hypothetical protein